MRILIIRHGDPDYELDSLTEKGKREAKLLAERLKDEKIDYVYSSPLGRAKLTCEIAAKAMGKEKEIVVKDWLREFEYLVDLPTGEKEQLIWDLLPEFWTKEDAFYDRKEWLNQPFMQEGNIPFYYQRVYEGFDELLAKHGYVRDGRMYRAERPNRDTIALFCHFGLECVLLSHLFGVPQTVLTHCFVAAPTSVTTLYSEERRQGKAFFRCAGFGDTGHLYAHGEKPSFAARFCETFDSDERHD